MLHVLRCGSYRIGYRDPRCQRSSSRVHLPLLLLLCEQLLLFREVTDLTILVGVILARHSLFVSLRDQLQQVSQPRSFDRNDYQLALCLHRGFYHTSR